MHRLSLALPPLFMLYLTEYMKSKTPHRTGGKAAHSLDDHAAVVILSTLADTTWRIFVPVIIFAALGIWADVQRETMPWFTLSGVAIGFAIAIWLIRQQLRQVAADEAQKATRKESQK